MLKTLYKNVGVMPTTKTIDLLPFGVNFKVILESKGYNGITTQEIVVPRWWTKKGLLIEISQLEDLFEENLTIKTWETYQINWDLKVTADEYLWIKCFTGWSEEFEFPVTHEDLLEIDDLETWFKESFPNWEAYYIYSRPWAIEMEERF